MSVTPTASIVIPTRARPSYLDVTLASLIPQARSADAEVLVVSDGLDPETAAIVERHGARVVSLPEPRGANAARNAGVRAARGDLIVFVDDDVEAPPGWLVAVLDGVHSYPHREVFGGPIRARLEGGGPRACGREGAPITTLDLGPNDCDTSFVWSANMAIRRSAFDRVGPFDETIYGRGEEEEWQRRYASRGGTVRYLAHAGLDHRRTAGDSTVRSLARAEYWLGRTSRRYNIRRGTVRPLRSELLLLARCAWHTVRRRCAIGIVMGAHSLGRLREALTERGERLLHRGYSRCRREPPQV